jgi:hypothetical protein
MRCVFADGLDKMGKRANLKSWSTKDVPTGSEAALNSSDVYIVVRLGNRACLLCGDNALAGGIDQLHLNGLKKFSKPESCWQRQAAG